MPLSAAQPWIASGSSVTSAVTKLRSAPCTSTWLTYGQMPLNFDSMADGATYLPPEVLIRSFLRSVILQEAALVDLADVAGVQPAVASSGLGGGLAVVVALHDARAAHQDLAVLGDLDLGAGQGHPTVPKL